MRRFHNLFLALRPPLSVANQIMELRRSAGLSGQWLSRDRLHLSLLSLGRHPVLPLRLINEVEEALADADLCRCEVEFDQLVQRPERALLTSSKALDGVRRLQLGLKDRLSHSGLPVGRNMPRAHLTLGYNVMAKPTRMIDPIRWTAGELVLIDSLYGEGKHLTMARWPLARETGSDRALQPSGKFPGPLTAAADGQLPLFA